MKRCSCGEVPTLNSKTNTYVSLFALYKVSLNTSHWMFEGCSMNLANVVYMICHMTTLVCGTFPQFAPKEM